MTAHIIDGKALASQLKEDIQKKVSTLGIQPGLAVILVGEDPASKVYVGSKIKACEAVGMQSFKTTLPENTTQEELLLTIDALNRNRNVHGILLQLPLPGHLDKNEALYAIDPVKDVDGLHPANIGKLTAGHEDGFVPCTPLGALKLIKSVRSDLRGLNALVIGCSLLFGRPMGQLLLMEDCTVTYAHRYTQNLPDLCRQADIVTVATGQTHLVKGDWIKDGATVIDVGINRLPDNSLTGDVDFEQALKHAGAITPVPGGVGPMTVACLLLNTLKAAEKNLIE